MPPLSAYTHFESLLFFQCLVSLDARPTDFSAISDTLQKNKFIKEDDAFDTNRLSPQALEELYTSLLKEELNEPLSTNGHSQDGTTTISKKRKVSSNEPLPQPPAAKIAGLVSQLYARYKDRVTREIREEEKKFQDISQEIERLHKDAVLESQVAAPSEEKAAVGPPVVAVDQARDRDSQKSVMPTQKEASTVKTAEQSLSDVQARPAITTQQSPLPPPAVIAAPLPAKSDIAVPTSDTFKGQVPQLAISRPRNAEPQQPQTSQLPRVSQSPQQQLPLKQALSTGQPPAVPVAATPPMGLTGNGNFYVPPQQNPSIPQLLPNFQVKVPPPPQPQRPPPQASPRGHATARNQPNLPPGSTIVFQAGAPATPAGSRHSSLGGPAYGRGTPLPAGSPNPPQIPPGQQQFQQWVGHPQADRLPATPLAPSPYVNQPMMPKQGTFIQRDVPGKPIMVPQSHEQPTPAKIPAMEIQTPQAQISMQKIPSTLGPSLSGLKQQRPHRPSMDTSGSLTPWKRTPSLRLNIPDTPRSPPRPRAEDISPISARSASPVEPSEITPKETAPSRRRGHGRKQSPSSDLDIATKKSEHLTATSLTKRTGRSASTRSRARSVASRDEEIALESGTTHRKIKDEAPSTPAGASEDAEVETRPGSRRKAAAVVMGDEVPPKTRGKRKRGASEGLEPDTIRPTPSRGGSSQLVYCTRNFTRTGAPIMNDVAAHKHASIFAKPLTEREAPGYKDLIYRPQDLKSIKSALNQGNRAAAAATEAASSSSTAVDGDSPMPGSGAPSKNAAWLAKTPELIPPKAIVNSSQLEKELIRMFANAIMFNPAPEAERGFGPSFRMIKSGGGPSRSTRASSRAWDLDEGGISRDTREMCDDVEKAVTKWRAAERTTSTDEMTNKTTLSLRGSSGESNMDTTDDHK